MRAVGPGTSDEILGLIQSWRKSALYESFSASLSFSLAGLEMVTYQLLLKDLLVLSTEGLIIHINSMFHTESLRGRSML